MTLFRTRFAIALIIFSLLGAGAAAGQFCSFAPAQFPFLSWTGWTIKSFLESPKHPNIVFLGSSLVLVPLDGIDADFLNKKIDGSQHHNSCYFESKFKEATGLDLSSFTFALPGEMPSDAFLIVSNLLQGEKKPEVIVYGVGPRDFLDNLLPSPSATDPFRFLSRFGKIDPIASRVMTDWTERLNYELGKIWYIYGQRADISERANKVCSLVINEAMPLPKGAALLTADDRHLLFPEYRPCEVGKGQAFFRPSQAKDWANFSDNLAEYKKRYEKLKWDTYITQMEFFADTLEVARNKGIKVVVVMMPITDINRSLLSDLNWNTYRKGVIAVARRKGAATVDLSETDYFKRSDFMDTVHLHSAGGRKWLDIIVKSLSLNQTVLSVLEPVSKKASSKLAEREALQL